MPPDISSWEIPRAGFLVFEFEVRKKDTLYSSSLVEAMNQIKKVLRDPGLGKNTRIATIDKYFDW